MKISTSVILLVAILIAVSSAKVEFTASATSGTSGSGSGSGSGTGSGISGSGSSAGTGITGTGTGSGSGTGSNSGSGSGSGSSQASSSESNGWSDAGNFLIGFAEGIEVSINQTTQLCFNDVDLIFDDFETGFEDIKTGFKDLSVTLVQEGLQSFGNGVLEVAKAFNACSVDTLVKDIENIGQELSKGTDGVIEVVLKEALNIFHHGELLTTDFKNAISYWEAGDYLNCGKNVGIIVGVLLQD